MRAEARGESGTLMASTPRPARRRAPSISLAQLMPLGGTISTRVTNLPFSMRDPTRERWPSGAGGVSVFRTGVAPETFDAALGIDGAHGRAHGANVVGRGSAAAADDLRAGGDGFAGEAGHVFRRAEVDVAALDGAGHAGIGHGGEGKRGGFAHGLNGGEHGGRAGGAVDADGACAPLGEQGGGLLGRGAVEAVAFVVDGDHDQHGQMGGHFARGDESFAGLVERGHGFDDEHVERRRRRGR